MFGIVYEFSIHCPDFLFFQIGKKVAVNGQALLQFMAMC